MKKDIEIPEVKDVYIAVVQEYNKDYKCDDWNAYIINDKDVSIEMIMILSGGYNDDKITSNMRKKIEIMPPKSFAKVEYMTELVLGMNNQFQVTFFENNKMFDKIYTFNKNTINVNALQEIPLISFKGILAK